VNDEAFLAWARATHPSIILDMERAYQRYTEKSHLITSAEGQCVLCGEWGYNEVCWATKNGDIICASCEEPTKTFEEIQEMEVSE